MSNEIEITIYTNDDVRVSIDEWDDGGVWLGLRGRGHGGHCTLTRAEAQKMRDALDVILAKYDKEPIDPNKWAFDNGLESF